MVGERDSLKLTPPNITTITIEEKCVSRSITCPGLTMLHLMCPFSDRTYSTLMISIERGSGLLHSRGNKTKTS